MKSWRSVCRVVLVLGYLTPASGQRIIQFNAATIKLDQRGPGARGMKGGPGTDSPGRVSWQKVWLRDLVAMAFHVDPSNVSGPDWTSSNGAQLYRFTATMPADTSRQDFELMLQRFLVEQFKLTLHHEPRMFPSYELVVAPGGPRLKTSADPNAPDLPGSTATIGSDGFPVLPPGHGYVAAMIHGFHGRFQNFTMAEFAQYLINYVTPEDELTHYVTDKTGLTGMYDFTLKFDADQRSVRLSPQVQAALGPQDDSEPGSGLPNVFKAVEQQLGLKLMRAKDIPLDTIVIAHAERIPTGN